MALAAVVNDYMKEFGDRVTHKLYDVDYFGFDKEFWNEEDPSHTIIAISMTGKNSGFLGLSSGLKRLLSQKDKKELPADAPDLSHYLEAKPLPQIESGKSEAIDAEFEVQDN